MVRTAQLLLALSLLSAGTLDAQDAARRPGPVIQSGGAVFAVPDPAFPTPLDHTFRAVFDVSETADKPGEVNDWLNSAARFINMHAQAGVPAARIHVAVVVHGAASRDLLSDAHYRRRFGMANPNTALLDELSRAGAQIVLCGQTAASRGLTRDALAPQVKVALSAMTALVLLQDQGYRLIPF